MIYLHRGLDRASCETEERAQALEALGYRRCSASVHRALWAIADAETRARLGLGGEQPGSRNRSEQL